MSNFFSNLFASSRKTSVENEAKRWLKLCAESGIVLNPPATEEEVLEHLRGFTVPFQPDFVLLVLGYEREEEPYQPTSLQVTTMDLECIEDTGDYADVINRLAEMTGGALRVENIQDSVDIPGGDAIGSAHIEFDCNGQRIVLDCEQHNDWFSSEILECMAALLTASGSTKRYFCTEGDGQNANIACAELRGIARLVAEGLDAEVLDISFPLPGVKIDGAARPEDVAVARELRRWLALYAECGIQLNEPFTEDQILQYIEMLDGNVKPGDVLLFLGWNEEQEPWRPNSPQAFNLDTEYIDHDEAYAEIVMRMAGMTGGELALENVTSSLDMPDGDDEGRAHISFDCNGQHVEIGIAQDADWADEMVLHCMAALLNASGSAKCIFAIPSDDQTITMACTERDCLARLTRKGLKATIWEDHLPMDGVTITPVAR